MQIYNYHPDTKEFLSENTADESPLEEGVYLLPANATFLKPPETGEYEIAVFENDSWNLKSDFRGQIFYLKTTKASVIITEIGVKPDMTMTNLAPAEFDKWDYQANNWFEDLKLVLNAEQAKVNLESKKVLNDTDWKILRHRDQLDLGVKTSLSEEEYFFLLQQRQESREKVVEVL